jgi:hypothetical protein
MRTKVLAIVGLAAVILAVIIAVAPHSTTVANEVSGEAYAVDILGLTKDPIQQVAAH